MAEPKERQSIKKQPVSTKAQKLFSLFHIDSKYPIGARICWLLPIVDIINLTKTCKVFSNLYGSLIPSQWNVEKRLSHFVRDVISFRCQMASTNALISGSFALQFFHRVYWPASDLDINVHQGSETLESYLCRVEGYTLQRSTDGERYNMIGVDKIRTLIRRPANAPETQIQICISQCLPVEQILTGFYSTHVINFISWNKAYALFPRPSFVEKTGYLLHGLNEHLGEHIAKYRNRGWRIQDVVWEGEDPVPALKGLRRVGDRHTWTIPLSTAGIEPSNAPDFVLEFAGFTVEKSLDASTDIKGGVSHLERYEIKTQRIRGEVLRFEYLSGCLEWSWFLLNRVLRLTELKLFKEKPHMRPHNFRDLIRDPVSPGWESFHRSTRWTYYDDEVPKWYAQWLRLSAGKTGGKVLLS